MHLFGPTDEERGSHPQSSTTTTPFTFIFTQIQTSDSETAPFLKLPAELRNRIYELVAKDQWCLMLFEGRIVLPPLGSVCKKIRTEMRDIFEKEVVCTKLSISALVVNFDFQPLFNWLDEHDQRTAFAGEQWLARPLSIRLTCRPELFDESSPRFSTCTLGESLKKQRLHHFLLQNLMATMNGWSWELTMYFTGNDWALLASFHHITKMPFFHANPRCRRMKSGFHYYIILTADDTWRCLNDSTPTTSQVTNPQNKSPVRFPDGSITNFYTRMYDALVRDESMRTDVDRKLALAVREACQSHCNRAERDAVAASTDLSHLGISMPSALPAILFVKWALVIFERAAKELSRLEVDLRVERQKRHELSIAKKAEKAARDAKDQHDMARRSDKRLQTEDSSKLPPKQRVIRAGLRSGGTKDEFEELARMVARWQL